LTALCFLAENGLFPRPDADRDVFYLLELLCWKALAMGIVLPLPLSEAFFKLISERIVEIMEIF
jgi:hypothetical protein